MLVFVLRWNLFSPFRVPSAPSRLLCDCLTPGPEYPFEFPTAPCELYVLRYATQRVERGCIVHQTLRALDFSSLHSTSHPFTSLTYKQIRLCAMSY